MLISFNTVKGSKKYPARGCVEGCRITFEGSIRDYGDKKITVSITHVPIKCQFLGGHNSTTQLQLHELEAAIRMFRGIN